MPWRCLLRGVAKATAKATASLGEGNLPWPQGNDPRILAGKPLLDAIELRQHVLARRFERAPPALVSHGNVVGSVPERACHGYGDILSPSSVRASRRRGILPPAAISAEFYGRVPEVSGREPRSMDHPNRMALEA